MEKFKTEELFDLLIEECAEVIQVVSKIKRFGLMNEFKGRNNAQHLIQEIADVFVIVNLLKEEDMMKNILTEHNLSKAQLNKWIKLQSILTERNEKNDSHKH